MGKASEGRNAESGEPDSVSGSRARALSWFNEVARCCRTKPPFCKSFSVVAGCQRLQGTVCASLCQRACRTLPKCAKVENERRAKSSRIWRSYALSGTYNDDSNPFARSIFYWAFPTIPPAGNSLATAVPRRQPDTRSPSFPLHGLFLSLHFSALRCGVAVNFILESEGRCLIRELKAIKLVVDNVENGIQGKRVAEVTVGSVTIPIFYSLNRIKLLPEAPVAGAEGIRGEHSGSVPERWEA